MTGLSQYDARLEQPYEDANSHEWSAAAEAAFETLANLKKAKADLLWMCGNEAEKTSEAVAMRWSRLKSLMEHIARPGNKDFPDMMAAIADDLHTEMKSCDEANVDYNGDERATEYFSYYLREYSDVIIKALKKQMQTNDWGDAFEAELFENNI